METAEQNPLVALTWTASTMIGAAVIVSLLLVILINLDQRMEPVPAGEARLEARFTDEAPVMEGPLLIAPGRVELGVVNTTDEPRRLTVCHFGEESEWMRERFRLGVGQHADAGPGDLLVDGRPVAAVTVDPNSTLTTELELVTGFYLFDWMQPVAPNSAASHVWRIGAVEVTD